MFTLVADPIGSGLVESLAHPGANITGFTNYEYAISGKWLEVLKENVPRIVRVLAIRNPANAGAPGLLREIESGAHSFGVQVTTASTLDAAEMERTIEAFAREPNGGPLVLPRCYNLESTRVDCGTGRPSSVADNLPVPILCNERWFDILWHQHR